MLRGNLRRALALAFRRTHRGRLRRVVLYETEDCALCREAYRELSRLALELPLEILRVDIDSTPELRERYALRVPVVALEGRELDAAGVGESTVRRFLGA